MDVELEELNKELELIDVEVEVEVEVLVDEVLLGVEDEELNELVVEVDERSEMKWTSVSSDVGAPQTVWT
eukprot:6484758-Amphidinium_carterae.1